MPDMTAETTHFIVGGAPRLVRRFPVSRNAPVILEGSFIDWSSCRRIQRIALLRNGGHRQGRQQANGQELFN